MAFPSGWKYYKPVTIDATPASLGGNLSNVPQLVKITADADLAYALATGYDIRFTTAAAPTVELNYERIAWSGGGGSAATAIFWVTVPTILAASGASLLMYFGNAGAADGENAAAVWTVVNYEAVWHLDDNGNQLDSTGNGYTLLAPGNAPDFQQAGQNNLCCYFDRPNSEYLEIDSAPVTTAPFTVSALFNPVTLYYYEELFTLCDKDVNNDYWRVTVSGPRPGKPIEMHAYDGIYHYAGTSSSFSASTWQHAAGVESASNNRSVYLDGSNKGTNTGESTPDNVDRVSIGRLGNTLNINYFLGYIEEFRISSDAKSDDWIKYEALSQLTAGNYVTFGAMQSLGGPFPHYTRRQMRGGMIGMGM